MDARRTSTPEMEAGLHTVHLTTYKLRYKATVEDGRYSEACYRQEWLGHRCMLATSTSTRVGAWDVSCSTCLGATEAFVSSGFEVGEGGQLEPVLANGLARSPEDDSFVRPLFLLALVHLLYTSDTCSGRTATKSEAFCLFHLPSASHIFSHLTA